MRPIQPVKTLFSASLVHSKHFTRIQLCEEATSPPWTRFFHASARLRAVDLAYRLHDNSGKAKGDPIVMIHGLFGSKRNNQSVAKYRVLTAFDEVDSMTNPYSTVSSLARSSAPSTRLTRATTASPLTIKSTTTLLCPKTLKPSCKNTTSETPH